MDVPRGMIIFISPYCHNESRIVAVTHSALQCQHLNIILVFMKIMSCRFVLALAVVIIIILMMKD